MNGRSRLALPVAAGLVIGVASAGIASFPLFALRKCASDAVVAGTVCLDKYEASVWRVPDPKTTNAFLAAKIQQGRATRADLLAAGAIQLGLSGDDYAPCGRDGRNCADDIYAVSLPSETPSAFVTWFQAQAACANAGKRLPTNAEWQVGANGAPDPGLDDHAITCNSDTDEGVTLTASRSGCVSARGAFDMIGNLEEWVGDWLPASAFCPGWAGFSDDQMCLAGASTTRNYPGALVRGGWFASRAEAGPLAVTEFPPLHSAIFVGFRCAR